MQNSEKVSFSNRVDQDLVPEYKDMGGIEFSENLFTYVSVIIEW